MDKQTQTEIEAATFRRIIAHMQKRTDAQNIDLMGLAGFCRNCFSKWYAAEAQEHGIEIPRQVALVGFDDIAIASFTFPPLTTVKQDTQLAGELLVETLLTMINGEETKTTLIPPELVVRKSCGS